MSMKKLKKSQNILKIHYFVDQFCSIILYENFKFQISNIICFCITNLQHNYNVIIGVAYSTSVLQ